MKEVDMGTKRIAVVANRTQATFLLPTLGIKSTMTAAESPVLETAFKRDTLRLAHADYVMDHREEQDYALTDRARAKAKRSVPELLEELSLDRGMSWRDIAQIVGVSVSAIRKWRHAAGVSASHRLELGRLAAFLDLLDEMMVHDPVGWLAIPVVDGYTVTHLDLYEASRPDLVLDIASHRLLGPAALAEFDPAWYDNYRSKLEIFAGPDGGQSFSFKTH